MKRVLTLLLPLLFACACETLLPDTPPQEETNEQILQTRHYVNLFAYNVMSTYYLWEAEVEEGLKTWAFTDEPKEKVKTLRYKDDRWTQMLEDYNAFVGEVSGNTTSFGFDFFLTYADADKKYVLAIVTYTYADSPAAAGGLRRGDVITTLNGKRMTPDNYIDLLNSTLFAKGSVTLGLLQGREISMTAVQMYENPVQTVTTIVLPSGKKVGYLHYASFTLASCADLESAFRGFREEGIDELVLDLRYNGGGYVTAGTALASMIAPLAEVEAGSVFNMDIYNERLTQAWGDNITPFAAEMTVKVDGNNVTVHPGAVNPDLRRVWVITGTGTASASEALICGLSPYMDVMVVGEKTAGKFCGGFILDAKGWYEELQKEVDNADIDFASAFKYCGNWGIYVMVSRYTDKDRRTLSMPDGIAPGIPMQDDPMDGFALGDPQETILSAILSRIEGSTKAAAPLIGPDPLRLPDTWRPDRPGRILSR